MFKRYRRTGATQVQLQCDISIRRFVPPHYERCLCVGREIFPPSSLYLKVWTATVRSVRGGRVTLSRSWYFCWVRDPALRLARGRKRARCRGFGWYGIETVHSAKLDQWCACRSISKPGLGLAALPGLCFTHTCGLYIRKTRTFHNPVC